jgi:hypothetical protein
MMVLATAEAVGLARGLATRGGYSIDVNRELYGLGGAKLRMPGVGLEPTMLSRAAPFKGAGCANSPTRAGVMVGRL